MAAVNLTAQYVRELAKKEDELQQLREGRAAASVPDPATLAALATITAERDGLLAQHNQAKAALDAARASTGAEVQRLESERDDLRAQRDLAKAALDAARASTGAEVQRLKSEAQQLSEELRQERDRVRELESLLAKAKTSAPPGAPTGNPAAGAEPAGLRERLALAQYELELERERSRKFYDENDQLRDELHQCEKLMGGIQR